MKMIGWFALAFLAAHNATNNLTRLLPVNPNYEAAWWKVALFLILFTVAIYFGLEEDRRDR